MMRVKPTAPFSRRDFARSLDAAMIGNWMLFGVNLVRQQRPGAFRVVGDLPGADRVMNEAVFVGTYPGLTQEMLGYMIETVRRYVKKF